MATKLPILIVILGLLAIAAVEIALLTREHDAVASLPSGARDPSDFMTADPSGPPEPAERNQMLTPMADQLEFIDTPDAFAKGRMRNVSLVKGEPARIVLDFPNPNGYPREGTWTSPQLNSKFPFTEFLPCWNLSTPPQTGVQFHVRCRDVATKKWSPWLRIGSWGRTTSKERTDKFDFGYIDDDTLKLDRPADGYQIRATLQSYDFDTSVNPCIRRMSLVYSGPLGADAPKASPTPSLSEGPLGWVRSLDVPYIPQGDNAAPVTGMTCSPTSVSMVLQYWGVNRPTMENCLAMWDDHNEMFGNWANAAQRAGEVGLDAWLQRFRSWEQVKPFIAAGQPVIASIKYSKGTLAGSPNPELATWASGGHLLVIRGFTADGNIIVNDPGHRRLGNGLVMSAAGLARAWFGHGGVGYVIHPPAKPLPAALVKGPPPSPRHSATAPSGATTAPVAASLGH